MAHVTAFQSGAPGVIGERVNAIMASFRKAREQRKVYNRTYEELMSLTNRELNDLGIGAGQIPFIARQAANMVK